MLGIFMGAGCIVCCTFLPSEKHFLICCLNVFTGRAGIDTERAPNPEDEVSAVLAEGVS